MINDVLIPCDIVFKFLFYAAAIQCLKRKRLYEQHVEQLGNFQLRIHDQVWMLFIFSSHDKGFETKPVI